MKMTMEKFNQMIKEDATKRVAVQNEIAGLDEKISGAHAAMMDGMEAVHEAQDAVRTLEERRRARNEFLVGGRDPEQAGEFLGDAFAAAAQLPANGDEGVGCFHGLTDCCRGWRGRPRP